MRACVFLSLAAFSTIPLTYTTRADVTNFFDAAQSYTLVQPGATSDKISTEGYLFTYTRDKFWSSTPGGVPTGRFVTIDWPTGLQAQAVTAGPSPGPARITIQRVDGDVFDLPEFTFNLLANTAGAGATLEIMPKLNGEDGFADPLMFQASGYYGSSFTYNTTTPSYLGNTSSLVGFDTYQMSLYVDFAVTDITVDGPPVVPEPSAAVWISGGLLAFGFVRPRRRGLCCGKRTERV